MVSIIRPPFAHRLRHAVMWRLSVGLQWPRKLFYRLLSTAVVENRGAIIRQPLLVTGKGRVILGRHCVLGAWPSAFFFSGYIHIDVRESSAVVELGDDVALNNNAIIFAERSAIRIGNGTIAGTELTVYDSDFHGLTPQTRHDGSHACAPVEIGPNVFFGSRVTVLKGASIGENAVIAAGSVVTGAIAGNVMAGGIPAKAIKTILP